MPVSQRCLLRGGGAERQLNEFHMSILQRAKKFFSGPDKGASKERRRLKRMACHQLFECTGAGLTFPVTVVDVGFGGFRIVSEHSLGERGDLLHLRRISTDFGRHLTGAYTTGLMVKVAWVRQEGNSYEAGLHLPEAPGSMRISWFRELLKEMGMSESAIFSKRGTRRHRCRLPAQLTCGKLPVLHGLLLDLSMGGGLFGGAKASPMGDDAQFCVRWGAKELLVPVSIVGVRVNTLEEAGPKWLHSIKFEKEFTKTQQRVLYAWLDELAGNA